MAIFLITGATDGIGLATAQKLSGMGHDLILHGRNSDKLAAVASDLGGPVDTVQADFSDLAQVAQMGDDLLAKGTKIDVLINNAGVYKTANPLTKDGLDLRFVVNTLAPALLTQKLLPLIPQTGRILHLSSAAQADVDPVCLAGRHTSG